MTPLRQRMVDAMVTRGFAARTQESYVEAVARLARHYHRSPECLSKDEVSAYLLDMVSTRHLSYSTMNQAACAARFLYAKVLGLPKPALHKGTVVMSDMAIFEIGPTGLGVVQPYAPGPAADALARRGAGPFQALYRTTSMGAAAQWMESNGLPPPARGVRSNGEHAMLMTPPGAM